MSKIRRRRPKGRDIVKGPGWGIKDFGELGLKDERPGKAGSPAPSGGGIPGGGNDLSWSTRRGQAMLLKGNVLWTISWLKDRPKRSTEVEGGSRKDMISSGRLGVTFDAVTNPPNRDRETRGKVKEAFGKKALKPMKNKLRRRNAPRCLRKNPLVHLQTP